MFSRPCPSCGHDQMCIPEMEAVLGLRDAVASWRPTGYSVGGYVSPMALRNASRSIITDGSDGTETASRIAGREWSNHMFKVFRDHGEELMKLCGQFPPDPDAEIRLLEYCLVETTDREEGRLIRSAICKL